MNQVYLSFCFTILNYNDVLYTLQGAYAKKESAGMVIRYIQLDDIQNACGCDKFIGFRNIFAGYTGGSHIPCQKFDVQKEPA